MRIYKEMGNWSPPTLVCPTIRMELPRGKGKSTFGEQELAKAREAHQWALVAISILEERIERFSQ